MLRKRKCCWELIQKIRILCISSIYSLLTHSSPLTLKTVHPLAATCDYLCKLYHIGSQAMHMNYGVGYVVRTKFVIIDHNPLLPIPTMSLSICVCARFLLSFVAAAAGATFKVVFTLRESGKWSREQERRTCIIILDEYPQHQRHLQSYRLASLRDYAFFLSYLSITPLCISKIRILNPNLSLGTL